MEPIEFNIELFRNCDFSLAFACEDDAEEAFDLTGWSVAAKVKKRSGDKALVIDLEPVITDAAGGIISIDVARADIVELSEGSYNWDLVLITPGDLRLIPYLYGTCTIKTAQSD